MTGHCTPHFDGSDACVRRSTADVGASLVDEIRSYGPSVVTLSGGVDSSVVLAAASRALGAGVVAVTGVSAAVSDADRDAARAVASAVGVEHVEVATDELDVDGYRENGPKRCYFCKSVLVDAANSVAVERGWPAVVTGTNADDVVAGFRPGIVAAAERDARTPLADLGIDKAMVRDLAALWSVPTADRPASACLSSRIAYGVPISIERLGRVGRAEAFLRDELDPAVLPALANLRVRDLGDRVRVEVDADLVEEFQQSTTVADVLVRAGFSGSEFQIEPFRSGAMNETLDPSLRWS